MPVDPASALRLCGSGSKTWDVLAIRQGTLSTRRSHVFLNHDVYGEPDGDLEMSYSFWVLRTDDAVIVVDAGMSDQGARSRGRGYERSTATALTELNLRPEDVARVIVSHAHYDHIGGLSDIPGRPVTMAAEEYAFWRSDASRRPLLRSVVDDADLAYLETVAAHNLLTLTTGVQEAAPGVVIIPAPGHTPGELVVLVRTGAGIVVLACDAAHLDEELEDDRPFRHQTDLLAMYESLHLIRSLAQDPAVTAVVTGHDPRVQQRYPHLPGIDHVSVVARR